MPKPGRVERALNFSDDREASSMDIPRPLFEESSPVFLVSARATVFARAASA